MTFYDSIRLFFLKASLNVPLLSKLMSDHNVGDNVIKDVADELLESITKERICFTKNMLMQSFDKHGLGYIVDDVYQGLEADPLCIPYGTIACP